LRRRLEKLVDEWDSILGEASRTLRTRASLERELDAAECPTRFADLSVDRDRARRAIFHSKDIRNRYTILHLAWELGMLEEWGSEALDALAD
jgi:glycerol-1-phosphate dehydrogenase [NAD(P)+]